MRATILYKKRMATEAGDRTNVDSSEDGECSVAAALDYSRLYQVLSSR